MWAHNLSLLWDKKSAQILRVAIKSRDWLFVQHVWMNEKKPRNMKKTNFNYQKSWKIKNTELVVGRLPATGCMALYSPCQLDPVRPQRGIKWAEESSSVQGQAGLKHTWKAHTSRQQVWPEALTQFQRWTYRNSKHYVGLPSH